MKSFAEILEKVENVEEKGHPLIEALEFLRCYVPNADNLGESGDLSDLYFLVDRMSDAVQEAVPESACAAGCGRCCHYPTALFDITPLEWQAIEKHLDEMEKGRRKRLLHRFLETFVPRLNRLRLAQLIVSLPLPLVPTLENLPCPFLEEGHCAIYPARPLYCRIFGYATVMNGWRNAPHYYSCGKQGDILEAQLRKAGPQVGLPSANAICSQLIRINVERAKKPTGWSLLLNTLSLFPAYPVRLKERWLWDYARKSL